ncbi:MAG: glycerol kinase GlpK [Chloroflexi bacterium]|nr:glycerol kinase GlpK [Chloroflexota bacterium]
MAKSGYILALDQGTTGTTAILVDGAGKVLWHAYQEIEQIYPRPGWVEHKPEGLFGSCMAVIEELLEETEISPGQIQGIGIANQRETALVWDRSSGEPVANAVVWQCRRTAALCDALKAQGLQDDVRAKTGLPIDAYFSGTKLRWILDNITDGQRRAEAGELAFGTVDTWLLWNLTNGTVHATDVTNASRTMLYNINTLQWDEDLLSELDIPKAILPDVRPSSHVFGYVGGNFFGGQSIPIAGMAGDQHAALFGQACFRPGMTKNTYGTGSFVLMNTGDRRTTSEHGLISTPAWSIGGRVTYALEGSIFSTGSTVQWLRDELCMIRSAAEVEALARSVEDNGGVYIVPAFTGLGAPHWDMYARGAVLGITRGTNRGHFARAALESTAYQTRDVIEAMKIDAGLDIALLRVDGGGSSNDLMMQFQADILDMPLESSQVVETTALGAAYLAGLAVGFWKDQEEIESMWSASRRYDPDMTDDSRQRLCGRWSRAVDRALRWAEE